MAQDHLVKDRLTNAMIEGGEALVHKLDGLSVAPTAALWLFMPEVVEWRLLIATPDVATKGPRELYAAIQRAIQSLGAQADATPLSAISAVEEDAEIVRLLRTALPTGPGVHRVRLSRNAISGHFIEDALVYRIL